MITDGTGVLTQNPAARHVYGVIDTRVHQDREDRYIPQRRYTPVQELAAAVLYRAVQDARGIPCKADYSSEMKLFLEYWIPGAKAWLQRPGNEPGSAAWFCEWIKMVIGFKRIQEAANDHL